MKKTLISVFAVIGWLVLTLSQQVFAGELSSIDYSLQPKNNHVKFLTQEEISFKLVQDYRFAPLMGVATPSVGIVMNPSIGMDRRIIPKEGWLKDMVDQDTFTSIAAPDYSLPLKLEKFPFIPSFGLHSFDGSSSLQGVAWPNIFALQLSNNKDSTQSLVWQNQEVRLNWTKKGNFF